jgi:hypothetical protein
MNLAQSQVEAAVLAGPRANIDSFADAMGRLHGAVTFFDEHQCASPPHALTLKHVAASICFGDPSLDDGAIETIGYCSTLPFEP